MDFKQSHWLTNQQSAGLTITQPANQLRGAAVLKENALFVSDFRRGQKKANWSETIGRQW